LVKWYALIEHGEEVKGEGAWENARKGEPEVTEDSGIFERKEGELWSEIAEDESLEEEWVKGGGAGCEVAAVKWGRGKRSCFSTIIILAHHPKPFCDSLRSSQQS